MKVFAIFPAMAFATAVHACGNVPCFAPHEWMAQENLNTPCFPIGNSVEFCAPFSKWRPVLSEFSSTKVSFREVNGFEGDVNIVSGADSNTLITKEEISAFLGNKLISRERRGFQIDQGSSRISGLPARTVVFEVPFEGVTAFSIVMLKNDALIAQTHQKRTTFYLADHKAVHASFLNAIRIEGVPL